MRFLILNRNNYIIKEKPSDYTFMEESERIMKNHPDTWNVYPKTLDGAMGIIKMEFKELENSKDKSQELVHLASACLYAWRMLNDTESESKSER